MSEQRADCDEGETTGRRVARKRVAKIVNPQTTEVGGFSNARPRMMDPAYRPTAYTAGDHVDGIFTCHFRFSVCSLDGCLSILCEVS